jgi:hypothetical protein
LTEFVTFFTASRRQTPQLDGLEIGNVELKLDYEIRFRVALIIPSVTVVPVVN